MTSKRIQVKETQKYWRDFDGTLESIIAALQAELDAGWVGLEYDSEPYVDDGYCLYKFREENDKEYENRMKQLEKEKKRELKEELKAKERRRKEYEKLKKEFECVANHPQQEFGFNR